MIKHVKPTRLSVCRGLAVAALGCLALSANAAYQSLIAPAGWAAGGGAGGSFVGAKAANTATFLSSNVTTNASLNVGGRAVTVPATMRFAANAPRIAASAVMLYPGIRTAAAVAGWLGLAGLLWDEASQTWKQPDTSARKSDGLSWVVGDVPIPSPYNYGQESACAYANGYYGYEHGGISGMYCLRKNPGGSTTGWSYMRANSGSPNCPTGWYITPAGCVQTPPVKTLTEQQAEDELAKQPMPAEVPKHIPTPLPVELPEWQPLFIPTGNPVPNPNYNPNQAPSPTNQPYVQPGVKVDPAPSPSAPWQADVKPVNRPTASPTGSTDPSTESSTNPSNDTPRQDQKEDQDFCDKHKESIICAEADTPEQDLPTGKLDISYNYVDIFGNGSCPSDAYLNTHGMSLKVWDWAATCDHVQTYFRPVLIACCAFAAFVIVAAGGKE